MREEGFVALAALAAPCGSCHDSVAVSCPQVCITTDDTAPCGWLDELLEVSAKNWQTARSVCHFLICAEATNGDLLRKAA